MSPKEKEEPRPTVDNGPSFDRKQWLGTEEEKDMTQDPSPCFSKPAQLSSNTLNCPLKKAEVGAGDLNSGLHVWEASDLTHWAISLGASICTTALLRYGSPASKDSNLV